MQAEQSPVVNGGAEDCGPFEGPEKLLEIWWQDSAEKVPTGQGLRTVKQADWEDMLDLVHCKVLSTIQGDGLDAYMLSESSMFVWPHKLILKTCGTTTLLLGLEMILRLAAQAGFTQGPWRTFYSRKSFMFPDKQRGPHRDWKEEMSLLDQHFKDGKGFTVGPMNGDHWLLYMSQPNNDVLYHTPSSPSLTSNQHVRRPLPADQTMEILMTELDTEACQKFFNESQKASADAHTAGKQLSASIGIDKLFPSSDGSLNSTSLDAYLFDPCGYSMNLTAQHDRYATIHVTPEADCSYASFETNATFGTAASDHRLGVQEMVARVLDIFKPGRFSLTLFVSREEDEPETSGEQGLALLHKGRFPQGYRRTDKICYEFEDYDLLFSTFVRTS